MRPSSHRRKLSTCVGDHRLGLAHRFDADLQVVLDDVDQVVDAVEKQVVELRGFGLDIARHGEIDDEHRRMSARLDRALEHALAQDRQRARGRGDDDVEGGETVRQFGKRDRVGTEARASCAPRSRVRLATVIERGFFAAKCVAASSIISPAPISSTRCSAIDGNMRSASLTAAAAIEIDALPMSVLLRTSLATAKVRWNRRLRTRPIEPAASAVFTACFI